MQGVSAMNTIFKSRLYEVIVLIAAVALVLAIAAFAVFPS